MASNKAWCMVYGKFIVIPQLVSRLGIDFSPKLTHRKINVGDEGDLMTMEMYVMENGMLPTGIFTSSTGNTPPQSKIDKINMTGCLMHDLIGFSYEGIYRRMITGELRKVHESLGSPVKHMYVPYSQMQLSKAGMPFIVIGDYPDMDVMTYAAYTDAFQDPDNFKKLLKTLKMGPVYIYDITKIEKDSPFEPIVST